MSTWPVIMMLLQAAAALASAADPPERVGRVAYLDGHAIVQTGSRGFDPAVLNGPTTAGDRLVTQRDARAELSLGIATLWLDETTDVALVALTPDVAQIEIKSGTVNISVRDLQTGETVLVQGRTVKTRLAQTGEYRFSVLSDGRVMATVRSGQAQVDTGAVIFQQLAGETALIEPDRTMAISPPPKELDRFDRWCLQRQRQATGERAAEHVPRGMVGYEDLDQYGTWRNQSGYGMAWEPTRVATDWTPYRYGQWIWKVPWGWTWVDDTPWGFAPFHYGRWVRTDTKWFWLPGPQHVAPVYAPALVGWTEDPGDRSVIGWFPLGAQQRYVPAYPVSPEHEQRLNTFASIVTRGIPVRKSSSDFPDRASTSWSARSAFAKHPPILGEPLQSTLRPEVAAQIQ